jgi:hypothetical protein
MNPFAKNNPKIKLVNPNMSQFNADLSSIANNSRREFEDGGEDIALGNDQAGFDNHGYYNGNKNSQSSNYPSRADIE